MTRDRLIQFLAVGFTVICLAIGGMMLPGILKQSAERSLRYTDISVEGAPPFVALGTAMGALRGLIVDILWVRVNMMKEAGQFYEVMADADLITKLQPRFAPVWAFHGHNMAYNISVATHTLEERWEWVNAGIDLVRGDGIRANPEDLNLHRELAWWFAHKIDGTSDDAHNYYKQRFADEWDKLLGEPPREQEERADWMQEIADAPNRYAELIVQTPEAGEIVDRLKEELGIAGRQEIDLYTDFTTLSARWEAVTGGSFLAGQVGLANKFEHAPLELRIFKKLRADPSLDAGWKPLLAHIRKRQLIDRYNMKPEKMAEMTREIGPFDWRHPQSHAYYWARMGSGDRIEVKDDNGNISFEYKNEKRIPDEDVYKIMNNDRILTQAMSGLARTGLMTIDRFSNELPTRAPDPRWIDSIDNSFEELYIKHFNARGGGGETFINFMVNFMDDAVRMYYRSGEREKAEQCLSRLNDLFGAGAMDPNNFYNLPLDVYVMRETKEQYEAQPHIAPGEVIQSLRYGIRVGIGRDRPQVFKDSVAFADQVREFFKSNEWYDYETKFGGRITDLLGPLEDALVIAFAQVMTDPSITMEERMSIWSMVDKYQPELRARTYDRIMPVIESQWANYRLGQLVDENGKDRFPFVEAFTAPPNLDFVRAKIAAESKKKRETESEIQAIQRN